MAADDVAARRFSEELMSYGFEAGEVVYSFVPEFSRDDLKEALFEGTRRHPRPIEIRSDSATVLRFVPKTVTRLDDEGEDDPEHPEQNDLPEWWVEGWLIPSSSGPNAEGDRARMLIRQLSDEYGFRGAFIQRVPAELDSNGVIQVVAWEYDLVRRSRRRDSLAQ